MFESKTFDELFFPNSLKRSRFLALAGDDELMLARRFEGDEKWQKKLDEVWQHYRE